MEPAAASINVGCGKVLHEAVLVEALKPGHFSGIDFHVYEKQPALG